MTNITPGTVEHIDPTTIQIERNVRTDITPADLDPGFIDSIRENGVITPVIGWRDADGTVHVRAGQRRTLAAREAARPTIPVYITSADQADEAQRLIEQLVENDQRADLNDADRAAAWQALTLEGLSPTAIAKRTGTKRDRIKTGLTVAKSETGTQLIREAGLTLDQAAILLDFEDDAQTVADLTEIALTEPDYFAHAVQRAHQDRAAEALRAQTIAELAEKGIEIPDEPDPARVRLTSVRTTDGARVSIEDLASTEGITASVHVWGGANPEARIEYFMDNPAERGYALSEYYQQEAAKSGPMTDEQKAERKALIENNREWAASEVVRREWLATLMTRKTLPAVLAALLGGSNARNIATGISDGRGIAKDMLGIQRGYGDELAEYAAAHPTKALHIVVAVALGTIESTTSRENWRYPNTSIAQYLNILAAWGYPLSPVEKTAAGITDAQ